MDGGKTLAASFLALGFAVVSAILLFVEPGMGFNDFSDFFDPTKVVAASGSLAWLIEDVIYLGFAVSLGYLAVRSSDEIQRGSGLVAGALFVFLAAIGRIMAQLPELVTGSDQAHIAVLGLLPIRFAALRAAVLAIGIFAWRTTFPEGFADRGPALWRGLGWLVMAAAVVFVFTFLPMPLLLMVWAAWLAVRSRVRAGVS